MDMPQTISIGSGYSVTEWILMPRMAKLSKALPRRDSNALTPSSPVIDIPLERKIRGLTRGQAVDSKLAPLVLALILRTR